MKTRRILITGAAGLIGQNLVTRLKSRADIELICIDKHAGNCKIFRDLHPDVKLIEADLAQDGGWRRAFEGVDAVVLNHAQIGALTEEPFIANNVTATQNVLASIKEFSVPYIVHISSSVVRSKANDFYTKSKTLQENMVLESGVPTVVLRPTLMFGWFDRKHLGWLSRFMQRSLIFPVPGHGRYVRQPLYAGDFCDVIVSCLADPRPGNIYDISGREKVFYIDLIKSVKRHADGRSMIVRIPYRLFWLLLKVYALFSKDPPFTTKQLEALVIPEEFPLIEWPLIFGVKESSLDEALSETFRHPKYSKIELEF